LIILSGVLNQHRISPLISTNTIKKPSGQ